MYRTLIVNVRYIAFLGYIHATPLPSKQRALWPRQIGPC